MKKEQLMEILQACLLYFEGQDEKELNNLVNPENVIIGIKLCKFLQERL